MESDFATYWGKVPPRPTTRTIHGRLLPGAHPNVYSSRARLGHGHPRSERGPKAGRHRSAETEREGTTQKGKGESRLEKEKEEMRLLLTILGNHQWECLSRYSTYARRLGVALLSHHPNHHRNRTCTEDARGCKLYSRTYGMTFCLSSGM